MHAPKASQTLQTLPATLLRPPLSSFIPRGVQGRTITVVQGQPQPSESPQRPNRSVTLALTLGTGVGHGDPPSYNHDKSRPTWAGGDHFLVPDRVVRLPDPLLSAH